MEKIIVDYNPFWPIHFENIKEKLAHFLKGLPIDIQHVGSTAVPNLAAKPIIDLDIIFYKLLDFEQIKRKLELKGYSHKGNQGIVGREVFKRNGEKQDEILDRIAHHLYVCMHDCAALKRHILLRDYLRKNDNARLKYQKMKYEIAFEAHQNRKIYAEIKEIKSKDFIDQVIEIEGNTIYK